MMNSLSWLIYLADFFGNIKSVTEVVGVLGGLVVVLATVLRFVAEEENGNALRLFIRWFPRLIALYGVTVLLYLVIPSGETMYAIAASEVGEDVVKSETGGKALQALNAWLDKQIKPTE